MSDMDLIKQLEAAARVTTRLEDENKALWEFVVWLSPCGRLSNPPTHEQIGQYARNLMNNMKRD